MSLNLSDKGRRCMRNECCMLEIILHTTAGFGKIHVNPEWPRNPLKLMSMFVEIKNWTRNFERLMSVQAHRDKIQILTFPARRTEQEQSTHVCWLNIVDSGMEKQYKPKWISFTGNDSMSTEHPSCFWNKPLSKVWGQIFYTFTYVQFKKLFNLQTINCCVQYKQKYTEICPHANY